MGTEDADERIQSMMDAMPFMISMIDQDGIVCCNAEVLRVFGLSKKSEYIEHFYEMSPALQPNSEPSVQMLARMYQGALRDGYRRFEWEYELPDGELLPAEVTLTRIPWKGTVRLLSCARDLREIRDASERGNALEAERRATQAASEAKSAFFASMSHEIRTPMNAIIGMAELMRTDNLDAAQMQCLSDIQKMSSFLLKIINDILDFSRIEAGKLELLPVNYSIRALYDNICSLTRFTLSGKSLIFLTDIADDLPEVLFGDETRVRQIIVNILDNAVKYTREGSVEMCVSRALQAGRDWLSVVVKDTGIGIRAEDIPKLFGKFERFDMRKNRGITGTGLGLSISKQLVDMMGGSIRAESEYGKGTSFTILLPLAERNPEMACPEKSAVQHVIAAPDTKVLVADDSVINISVALGYLAKHGLKPDIAENGLEAVEMVHAKDYDIVFMDHIMPEMDGIEAARLIRSLGGRYKKLPIIALSANVVSGMREIFIKAGMNGCISKPIDKFELNKTLLDWLPPGKISLSGEVAAATENRAAGGSEAVLNSNIGTVNFQDDEELYLKALSYFTRNHASDAAALSSLLEAGDVQGAYRVAHTLKSSAAAIGAERLRRAAQTIETKLTNEGICDIGDIDRLGTEMPLVLNEIGRITPAQAARKHKKSAVGTEKMSSKLKDLEPLLGSGSADSLSLLEEIRDSVAAIGPAGADLISRMDDLDFSGALEVLPALMDAAAEKGK